MKTIDSCPVCGNNQVTRYPSRFDSWTISRFLRKTPTQSRPPVEVHHCTDCSFAYVNYRFDPLEEQQYYENYMTGEYVESRGVHWHAQFYHSKEYQTMRRTAAWEILSPWCKQVKSLLDFGGDTGHMIPQQFDQIDRYVLDVEARSLDNGVVCVDYATPIKVDLVMCSHTMEHVSDINGAMTEMTKRLNSNGLIYVEVPNENPGEFDNNFTWYEHINLFNIKSMAQLLANHNFELLSAQEINYPNPMTRSIALMGRHLGEHNV